MSRSAGARAKQMTTIGLTGLGGGRLAELADIAIRVPVTETYEVQELHASVPLPVSDGRGGAVSRLVPRYVTELIADEFEETDRRTSLSSRQEDLTSADLVRHRACRPSEGSSSTWTEPYTSETGCFPVPRVHRPVQVHWAASAVLTNNSSRVPLSTHKTQRPRDRCVRGRYSDFRRSHGLLSEGCWIRFPRLSARHEAFAGRV